MDSLLRRLPRPVLPPPGSTLVAAVSGGADSLCLLGLLLDLSYRPVVAHVDHSLRPESASEAQKVGMLAASLKLDFALTRVQPRAFAASQKCSLEEAARILRYDALARTAVQRGALVIATGHTADDQAETVLMHFLRGSGLAGLKGMTASTALADLHLPTASPTENLVLIRPLLEITRAETEAYCAARGWTPVFDPSNADTRMLRNRLRHELLPLLETYNPRVRRALTRTAAILAADYEALRTETGRAWEKVVDHMAAGAVFLDRAGLLDLPLAYQRGVLRRAIAELRPDLRDIGLEAVSRALAFAEAPIASAAADLAAGLCLRVQGNLLGVCEWAYEPDVSAFPQLSLRTYQSTNLRINESGNPGIYQLGSGWRVRVETQAAGPETAARARQNQDPWTACFDAGAVGERIALRTRRPGDRIQPLGMAEGSVKVARLMVNQKVPAAARQRWPLLVKGGEVLWVAGLRVHHAYRVTAKTERVLVVSFERVRKKRA